MDCILPHFPVKYNENLKMPSRGKESFRMTEFDLMISGQLYNAEVPQLQAMRRRAAELCHRLELLSPGQAEQRQAEVRQRSEVS